jgi:hypothetical protein
MYVPRIGDLVTVRGPIIGGTYRVRPAVVTAAAGDIVTAKVGHGSEVYVGLPKWVRGVTPVGWTRS